MDYRAFNRGKGFRENFMYVYNEKNPNHLVYPPDQGVIYLRAL